jgi:hypothetical protein
MSDIENLRYELGKEAKQKGESLHDAASESWIRGYQKSNLGSNVMPKNFGKDDYSDDWDCYCGYHNTSKRRHLKAGIEVCWNCTVERSYSQVKEDDGI